jgi:hypothetical protein
MAASITIEEEFGTCTGFLHPHNGYYAGDFARTQARTDALVVRLAVPSQRGFRSAEPAPGTRAA